MICDFCSKTYDNLDFYCQACEQQLYCSRECLVKDSESGHWKECQKNHPFVFVSTRMSSSKGISEIMKMDKDISSKLVSEPQFFMGEVKIHPSKPLVSVVRGIVDNPLIEIHELEALDSLQMYRVSSIYMNTRKFVVKSEFYDDDYLVITTGGVFISFGHFSIYDISSNPAKRIFKSHINPHEGILNLRGSPFFLIWGRISNQSEHFRSYMRLIKVEKEKLLSMKISPVEEDGITKFESQELPDIDFDPRKNVIELDKVNDEIRIIAIISSDETKINIFLMDFRYGSNQGDFFAHNIYGRKAVVATSLAKMKILRTLNSSFGKIFHMTCVGRDFLLCSGNYGIVLWNWKKGHITRFYRSDNVNLEYSSSIGLKTEEVQKKRMETIGYCHFLNNYSLEKDINERIPFSFLVVGRCQVNLFQDYGTRSKVVLTNIKSMDTRPKDACESWYSPIGRSSAVFSRKRRNERNLHNNFDDDRIPSLFRPNEEPLRFILEEEIGTQCDILVDGLESFSIPMSLLCLVNPSLFVEKEENRFVIDLREHGKFETIQPDCILSLLIGEPNIKNSQVYELYKFCHLMGLTRHQFLICMSLERIEDTKLLIGFFRRVVRDFEKLGDEEDEGEGEELSEDDDDDPVSTGRKSRFKSPFGQQLYNIFIRKFSKFDEIKYFEASLSEQGHNYYDDLLDELEGGQASPSAARAYPIDFHRVFQAEEFTISVKQDEKEQREENEEKNEEDDIRMSSYLLEDASQATFSHLHRTKKYANLKLMATGDSSKRKAKVFDVHKEILILKSNFFFQMFRFPGVESQQKEMIQIESMTTKVLGLFLEYVYLGRPSSAFSGSERECLESLYLLYVQAEMYFEEILKSIIEDLVCQRLMQYKKDSRGKFKRCLKVIGKIFSDEDKFLLPKNVKNRWIDVWSENLSIEREVLVNMIQNK